MATETPTMQLDPKYDDYDFPTVSRTTLSGHPGHTTPEQDAQVFQLRTKLEQAGYTDRLDTLTLVRYNIITLPAIYTKIESVAISASPEVRCRTFRTDVCNYNPHVHARCLTLLSAGSSTVRSGASSKAPMVSTIWSRTSSMRRRQRFSSIILNITTRQIKYNIRT